MSRFRGRHGTTWGYKAGCRCDDCGEAKRAYERGYKARWRLRSRHPWTDPPASGHTWPELVAAELERQERENVAGV